MERRILEFMLEHHMLGEGDIVCVGCSGGADSLFLLVFLWELSLEAKEPGTSGRRLPSFDLCACHVDHMLRGGESDGDRHFVEAFCRERGIPLYVYREDAARAAGEAGTGLEEAGRTIRRSAFESCVRDHGVTKIALAHHADDQAETVLFQLARGSALAGMGGMRPVQGKYIRPLLCVRSREIKEALTGRKMAWREDRSNASDDYARNRIRHRVLPFLEAEINTGSVLHLAQAAEHAAMAEDFLREEAGRRAREYIRTAPEDPGCRIISGEIGREPVIMRRYMVMEVLSSLCGRRKDLTAGHVEQILELQEGRTGREVTLPCGVLARSEYGSVRIFAPGGREQDPGPEMPADTEPGVRIRLRPGEELSCRLGKWQFRGRLLSAEAFRAANPGKTIPDKTYTKWLDYDKIKGTLVLRTRRPGDYLVISRDGRRQKIKDYMINHKIPRQERAVLPLLAGGPEVFWVVGGRIGANAEITEETTAILEITAVKM